MADWQARTVITVIGFFIAFQIVFDDRINARIKKMEAASTTAQQPLERNYLGTWEFSIPHEMCDTCIGIVKHLDNKRKRISIEFYSK